MTITIFEPTLFASALCQRDNFLNLVFILNFVRRYTLLLKADADPEIIHGEGGTFWSKH